MLRTLCTAVLLLALTGCTQSTAGGEDQKSSSGSASTEQAKLGACRALTPKDIAKSSDESPAVACGSKHTAQTFAVGSFPDAVAKGGPDGPDLGSYVYDQCQTKFQRFLGGNQSLILRSTLTWAWFRSTKDAWDQGSHNWRCDVVGGGEQSSSFVALPRSAKGLLLGKPDDRWMVCVKGRTVSGSPKIPCSDPHTWRAVTTIVLGKSKDPYPGDRLSQVRTRDFCSDSVGAWLNYPVDYDYAFTWFHEAEWKAGNRRSICWAKTAQ